MTVPASVLNLFPSLQDPGKRLVDASELRQLVDLLFSTASVVGGAAAPGPLLTAAINTVPSGTDVQLPNAVAGRMVTITAVGALTVNPSASNPANGGVADTINGATSYAMTAGQTETFIANQLGTWVATPEPEPPP